MNVNVVEETELHAVRLLNLAGNYGDGVNMNAVIDLSGAITILGSGSCGLYIWCGSKLVKESLTRGRMDLEVGSRRRGRRDIIVAWAWVSRIWRGPWPRRVRPSCCPRHSRLGGAQYRLLASCIVSSQETELQYFSTQLLSKSFRSKDPGIMQAE